MAPLSSFFTLNPYGTERAMMVPVPSYTNETNTAQSVPLVDRGTYKRAGVGRKDTGSVPKPSVSPQRPAAPDPQTTAQDTNTKAKRSPLVWIGLAAGVFVLFWVVRRAG